MNENVLTIIIGGDADKDEGELFTNPEKGIKQPRNAIYLRSYEELKEFLSPKKVDLLLYIMKLMKMDRTNGKSVSEIAKELKRHQEAISRDLHYLKKLKLIDLKKNGKIVIVDTKLKSIRIQAKA